MSWLTEQYDKAVGGGSAKRRRWDPVGDADAALSKAVGGGTSGDLVEEDEVPSPLMKAGDVDPNANLGPLQNLAKEKKGRKYHNMNKKGASILTTV